MIGAESIDRRVRLEVMSSGRFAEVRTPLILSILMVLMTQVGYLDLMNAWSGEEETLDDAEPVVAYSPATSVMYGNNTCLLYTSPSPRDYAASRMPSSA